MRLALRTIAAAVALGVTACGGDVVFDEGDASDGGGTDEDGVDPDEVERFRRACEARCSYPQCRAGADDAETCAEFCFDYPKECASEFADRNECEAACCAGACPDPNDPDCSAASVVCPSASEYPGE